VIEPLRGAHVMEATGWVTSIIATEGGLATNSRGYLANDLIGVVWRWGAAKVAERRILA